MADVTVDACDGPRFMRTAFPKQAVSPLMARQTGIVLFLCRVPGVFGEANGNGFFSSAGLDVRPAWAMTRLTPALFSFGFRARESLTHYSRVKVGRLIDMTSCTAFIPNVVARTLCWRRRFGPSDIGGLCHEYAACYCGGHERD